MIKAYHIPNGPKNLMTLFPGVDFSEVKSYYIEVKSGGTTIATSPINDLTEGECCDDKARIRFLNYLGAIDAVNFKILEVEHDAKSDSFQRRTSYPLSKPDHALGRFNVRSNDTLTLYNADYREEDMNWIDELVDSPLAWMEWTGTQGQADSYIPVIVVDMKYKKRKQEERFLYEVTLQVKLSNERFIIRN